MNEIIILCYEILTEFIPFLIAFLLFSRYYKSKNNKQNLYSSLWIFAFAVYVIAVYHITGVGTISEMKRYGIDMKLINLLPFSHKIDIIGYFENIMLFIPFGFILPSMSQKFRSKSVLIISGFSFSLLIELSQMFNNRHFDIDDLILNTLGAFIGYCIYKKVKISKSMNRNSIEPIVYIIVMFIGRLLFYNEFEVAKILYGF